MQRSPGVYSTSTLDGIVNLEWKSHHWGLVGARGNYPTNMQIPISVPVDNKLCVRTEKKREKRKKDQIHTQGGKEALP